MWGVMPVSPTPFQALLGADFERLAPPVRRIHGLARSLDTAGRAEVTVAPGLAAGLLCRACGLPRTGRDVPVEVRFVPDGGGERWYRRFADRRYASRIGVAGGRLRERFGPFDLLYRLTLADGALCWTLVEWRLLGLPLPRASRPRIVCREAGDGVRFTFDIAVAFPVLGPVIRYAGWLAPVTGARSPAGR